MSGKWIETNSATKEKFLIMQDRAGAMLGYDNDLPVDEQHSVYLRMLINGKKYVWETKKTTVENAILEAWQYYLEASKRGVEWIRGEVFL